MSLLGVSAVVFVKEVILRLIRKAGATSFFIRLSISVDGSGLKGYELKSDNEVIGSSMSNVYFSYGWRTGFKGTTYSLTVYGTGGYSGNLSGNITVG